MHHAARLVLVASVLALAPAAALAAPPRRVLVADDFVNGRTWEMEAPPDPIYEARMANKAFATAVDPGPRSVAVLLVKFSNDDRELVTVEEARQQLFTSRRSAALRIAEQTYGQVTLTGDAFGYYTIGAVGATCDYTRWAEEAQDAARAAGVDVDSYDHVLTAFPDADVCGWGGLAHLPGRILWSKASMLEWTGAHELGHNMGLQHGNSTTCTSNGARVPLSATCTDTGYGDPFDLMGVTWYSANGVQRYRLGLIDVQTVTADGVYHLDPVERPTGNRLLRIPRDTVGGQQRYLYLDTRTSIAGFDDFFVLEPATQGVSIRLAGAESASPLIIDTVPETEGFIDAPLTLGQTFTDPQTGISIRTIRVGSDGVDVAISSGGVLPAADPPVVLPADPGVGGDGLIAQYFDKMAGWTAETPATVTTTVPTIDFQWWAGSPDPTIPVDSFLARFTGFVIPPVTGEYVLSVLADNGVVVDLDEARVIDEWKGHRNPEGGRGAVMLTAGQAHAIDVLSYHAVNTHSMLRLAWVTPEGRTEIIPTTRLFTTEPSLDDGDDGDGGGDDGDGDDGGGDDDGAALPEPSDGDVVGGCAAGGGSGWFALVVLAVAIRRARRPTARADGRRR